LEDVSLQVKKFLIKLSAGDSPYNPSYSGGRDQKDHGSKAALPANSSEDPISKKPITKKGWW
jgi:hypothetical protein